MIQLYIANSKDFDEDGVEFGDYFDDDFGDDNFASAWDITHYQNQK